MVFNIKSSIESNNKEYERVLQGRYVELHLDSKTGKDRAIKKDACKDLYAPIAGIAP